MKKSWIFTALLVVVLVFSFTGCGNEAENDSSSADGIVDELSVEPDTQKEDQDAQNETGQDTGDQKDSAQNNSDSTGGSQDSGTKPQSTQGGSTGASSSGSSSNTGRRTLGGSNASNGKVVNIHTTAQMQVVLVKPDRFDNVSDIAEHLRSKHAVVLNLESTNKDVARRLVDFLSGCAYALDGKIKKIAISTYIITPYNVDIVGDLIDELENNGVYL